MTNLKFFNCIVYLHTKLEPFSLKEVVRGIPSHQKGISMKFGTAATIDSFISPISMTSVEELTMKILAGALTNEKLYNMKLNSHHE